jgi:1-acyl-sn-glycerol-3-phosphate acyltransferase
MILKAKHHTVIYPFFRMYTAFLVRRHFKYCRIHGEFTDSKLPVLLIANHFSWWDGFLALYFDMNVLKRKFYFMMLEEQLHKFWFFNYTGGFSVKKKSRSVIETLRYTNVLLADNRNMVLLFPQGEIQSMHRQDFIFQKGLDNILQNQGNPVQIVFLASLADYFSNKKPGIIIYHQTYARPETDIQTIQNSYNEFYQNCVARHILHTE